MPCVKDVTPYVEQVCAGVKQLSGVKAVHLFGSYAQNRSKPSFVVKDVDVIAETNFHSGDLMAIDNSRESALRIRPDELEDMGFDPQAVTFTKKFLSFQEFNIDHWATSSDGKLLHWGAIPDTQDEWLELHAKAEAEAEMVTGVRRSALSSKSAKKRDWKSAYDKYISRFIRSGSGGWFPSETELADVMATAIKVG